MQTRWISVVSALAAALTLASCTQPFAGSPKPGDTGATNEKTHTTESTASTEPSSDRPQEIDLNGKDPCAQIQQSDWSKFGIEHQGEQSQEQTFKSLDCYYSSVGDVTLVVTKGIDAWTEQARDVEISDMDPIEGFTTISIWNQVDRRSCYTAVDVADGQHLLTTATSTKANVNRDETCNRSYQLAESAMKTLVGS